jgi:hypothetical protein
MDFIVYYILVYIITYYYQLLVVVDKKPHSRHPGERKSPAMEDWDFLA